MSTKATVPDKTLSDDLEALFADTAPLTPEAERELGAAIRGLQEDPAFQADVLQAQVVEHVLAGMQAKHLNKSQLAKKWGKSRQYVGRILDEDTSVNFTLETICEMLSLVGKRMFIEVRDAHASAAHLPAWDIRDVSASQLPSCPWRHIESPPERPRLRLLSEDIAETDEEYEHASAS